MLTVYVTVEVSAENADRALHVGDAESYEAKFTKDHEPRNGDSNVLIEYKITFPDADSSGPEQPAAIDRIHALLDAASIEYDHRSNGVSQGDPLSMSRWVVQPVGNTDPTQTLTITAENRAKFEEQWAGFSSSVGLPSGLDDTMEVLVYGMATLDADTGEAPFVRMPV